MFKLFATFFIFCKAVKVPLSSKFCIRKLKAIKVRGSSLLQTFAIAKAHYFSSNKTITETYCFDMASAERNPYSFLLQQNSPGQRILSV